jgi:hypothetical protein
MLTLYFQKKRMDDTDKTNATCLKTIRDGQDKLWKDNSSLWAETGEIKKHLLSKQRKSDKD